MKEHQLQCVQQEAQAVKDKLSKLQAELEEKHEEVKTLQNEKEELTKLYSAEKEKAMNLLEISLSNRDEMEVCMVYRTWCFMKIDLFHITMIQLIAYFPFSNSSLQLKKSCNTSHNRLQPPTPVSVNSLKRLKLCQVLCRRRKLQWHGLRVNFIHIHTRRLPVIQSCCQTYSH